MPNKELASGITLVNPRLGRVHKAWHQSSCKSSSDIWLFGNLKPEKNESQTQKRVLPIKRIRHSQRQALPKSHTKPTQTSQSKANRTAFPFGSWRYWLWVQTITFHWQSFGYLLVRTFQRILCQLIWKS